METIRKPISIGIIGDDSTHVSAFSKILLTDPNYAGMVTVEIYPESRSTLALSVDRRPFIHENLKGVPVIVHTDKTPVKEHDAYLILNVDAALHLDLVASLCHFNKPIFVDKPFSFDVESAESCLDSISIPIMSASALRYTPFVKKARDAYTFGDTIRFEGPLSYQDGFPSFAWYGIHTVEMIHALFDGPFEIETYQETQEDVWVNGKIDDNNVALHFIKVGDPDFRIIHNETSVYQLNDDERPLYAYLLDEIMNFIDLKPLCEPHNLLTVLSTVSALNGCRAEKGEQNV